jgi:hypothetical protein
MESVILDVNVELNRVEVASSERGLLETWGVETERIQAGSFKKIYASCDKRRLILNTLPSTMWRCGLYRHVVRRSLTLQRNISLPSSGFNMILGLYNVEL